MLWASCSHRAAFQLLPVVEVVCWFHFDAYDDTSERNVMARKLALIVWGEQLETAHMGNRDRAGYFPHWAPVHWSISICCKTYHPVYSLYTCCCNKAQISVCLLQWVCIVANVKTETRRLSPLSNLHNNFHSYLCCCFRSDVCLQLGVFQNKSSDCWLCTYYSLCVLDGRTCTRLWETLVTIHQLGLCSVTLFSPQIYLISSCAASSSLE